VMVSCAGRSGLVMESKCCGMGILWIVLFVYIFTYMHTGMLDSPRDPLEAKSITLSAGYFDSAFISECRMRICEPRLIF